MAGDSERGTAEWYEEQRRIGATFAALVNEYSDEEVATVTAEEMCTVVRNLGHRHPAVFISRLDADGVRLVKEVALSTRGEKK